MANSICARDKMQVYLKSVPHHVFSSITTQSGHEVHIKKCQVMSIASGKSHPTYLYNLCGHVLSSVHIAKYLRITLTDELAWSSHVHLIHSRANSTMGFLRRNLRRCPAKLKRHCIHYVNLFYTGVCSVHLGSSFG